MSKFTVLSTLFFLLFFLFSDSLCSLPHIHRQVDISMVDQVVRQRGSAVGYAGVSGINSSPDATQDMEKETVLNHMLLKQLLGSLEEKERKLIEYRYFHDMTQTQVAKCLGISQVQVSRLEKKILLRMRKWAEE